MLNENRCGRQIDSLGGEGKTPDLRDARFKMRPLHEPFFESSSSSFSSSSSIRFMDPEQTKRNRELSMRKEAVP